MVIKDMKLIHCIGTVAILMGITESAYATHTNRQFRAEIAEGLDVVGAKLNADVIPDDAPGELGLEVYRTVDSVDSSNIRIFVPASMYMRAGGGLNLGFATDYAKRDHTSRYESSGSYTTQIGLGWNLSSYVRGELDWQTSVLKFHKLDNYQATYNTLGAMLYFDFARRYVMNGDITRRRHFVPFMGIGAGTGLYDFEGDGGASGYVIAAPRGVFGFNVMLNNLIGVDVYYQYQMMIGHGFGWDVRAGGVDNISNIMAAIRANF